MKESRIRWQLNHYAGFVADKYRYHSTTSNSDDHAMVVKRGCRSRSIAAYVRGVIIPLLVFQIVINMSIVSNHAGAFAYVSPAKLPLTNKTRTNFCARSQLLMSGSLTIATALTGMNITAAIHYGTPEFYFKVDNSTGKPYAGFIYDLQQQIAAIGGFDFNYVLVPQRTKSTPTFSTDTAYLKYILPYVDMYVNNYYSDTYERRAAGIGSTQRIIDASVVLVSIKVSTAPVSQYFGFLNPFTNVIWLCLFFMILTNGFIQYFLNEYDRRIKASICGQVQVDLKNQQEGNENHEQDRQEVELVTAKDQTEGAASKEGPPPARKGRKKVQSLEDNGPVYATYLSFTTFTTVETMEATRPAPMLLNLGFALCMMMFMAAYTANLVGGLVAKTPISTAVTTLEGAGSSVRICGVGSGTPYSVLKSTYPAVTAVKIGTTVTDLFPALLNDKCDGAVMSQIDWDLYSNQVKYNPGCKIVKVGPALQAISGGFPYKIDFSKYCTSVVEIVMSEIITGLVFDGTIPTLLSTNLGTFTDQSCSSDLNALTDSGTSGTFDVTGMAGIFILYVIAVVISMMIAAMHFVVKKHSTKINETYGNMKTRVTAAVRR